MRTLVLVTLCFVNCRATLWWDVERELDELTVCNATWRCSDMFASDERSETAVSQLSFDRFVQTRCRCDAECIEYGDCCVDAAEKHSPSRPDASWTCLPLRSKDNAREHDEMYTIYMVGKCPIDWQDDSIKQLCEVEYQVQSEHAYLKDVPVFSLLTQRTYANLYCATCHSDADSLAQWNVSIRCDFDEPEIDRDAMFRQENYVRKQRKWTMEIDNTTVECALFVNEFENITQYIQNTNSRRCIPSKSACDPFWPDLNDRIKCESYTALVTDSSVPSKTTYKNPHCAKCNGVLPNDTQCFTRFTGKSRMMATKRPVSFSMIFDFSFGPKSALSSASVKCKRNEIFDYLHNRCHAVICGAQFINRNGTCTAITDNRLDDRIYLNSSCHRYVIAENQDYVTLENNSIWLNVTNQMLDENEYEPYGSGNVSICTDRLLQDAYFRYSAGSPQRLLSDICLVTSVVCLAAHIAIHIALPKLCNLPGKNLLSLSVALFFGQLLFLVGMAVRDYVAYELCAAIGVATHWFYLSAFFWMNVMGFDICRTFSTLFARHRSPTGHGNRSTFKRYSTYAWGLPTVIVTMGLALDLGEFLDEYAPHYGTQVCWISNRSGLGLLFILPVGAILFENLILFTHTVHSILQQRKAAEFATDQSSYKRRQRSSTLQPPLVRQSAVKDKQQIRFVLYIKLGLIMGLGWVFGFVAALAKLPALWYPFILFNGLQGAFIFAAFDCKRKIYHMLYYWATKRHHPADTSSNSRATNSVTKMSAASRCSTTTITNEERLSRITVRESLLSHQFKQHAKTGNV